MASRVSLAQTLDIPTPPPPLRAHLMLLHAQVGATPIHWLFFGLGGAGDGRGLGGNVAGAGFPEPGWLTFVPLPRPNFLRSLLVGVSAIVIAFLFLVAR